MIARTMRSKPCAKIDLIAKTPLSAPSDGSFGNFGNFVTSTLNPQPAPDLPKGHPLL